MRPSLQKGHRFARPGFRYQREVTFAGATRPLASWSLSHEQIQWAGGPRSSMLARPFRWRS